MNREQTVEAMKKKLDQWNDDLNRLEALSEKIAAEKKTDYQVTVANLRKKRSQARDQLERLRQTTGDAFNDMRQGMDQAWQAVGESFREARQRYH